MSSRHSKELRRSLTVPMHIVAGGSWTARHIHNNNLRQHCHALAAAFTTSDRVTNSLRPAVRDQLTAVTERSELLTRFQPSAFPVVPMLLRIAAYRGRWIRKPDRWLGNDSDDPREIMRSLIEHLFATWQMPGCFDSAWREKGELSYLERDWYCHLAAGGSLRNVQGMPPSISSRALHLAMEAPAELNIRQALRFGQVRAAGGSEDLLSEVLASRMVRDLSNDALWSRLIAKLAAAENFDPADYGIIADALMELIHANNFRLADKLVGRPVTELLAHCRRYWNAMLDAVLVHDPEWRCRDISNPNLRFEIHRRNAERWARLPYTKTYESTWKEGSGVVCYFIEELTSQWQLVAESREMKHCVDTYGRDCRRGVCSIFSVRTREAGVAVSHLTIEVHRRTRRIVQVRGRRNRYFTAASAPLLRKWAEAMRLAF